MFFYYYCKGLNIKHLWQPGRRKPLMINDLGHSHSEWCPKSKSSPSLRKSRRATLSSRSPISLRIAVRSPGVRSAELLRAWWSLVISASISFLVIPKSSMGAKRLQAFFNIFLFCCKPLSAKHLWRPGFCKALVFSDLCHIFCQHPHRTIPIHLVSNVGKITIFNVDF